MSVLSGETSLQSLCKRNNVSPSLLYLWRKRFLGGGRITLETNGKQVSRQIRQLRVENDELKRMLAEANPALWYRRVWAKARVRGYNKSISSAYLDLKKAGLILPKQSYRELKANFEARKAYLVKPDGINQLSQSDITQLHIPGYRLQYILLVMDYFSRYLLALKLYPAIMVKIFIDGLENALEEAMRLSTFDLGQIIMLVTDSLAIE